MADVCNICKSGSPSVDKLIKCDCCDQKYHGKCIGISPAEAKVLQLKSRIISFYCISCKSNINQIPNLISLVDNLQKQIELLTNTVNESKKCKNEDLDFEVICNEIRERENKASNIIIYNIDECQDKKIEERIRYDNQKVSEVMMKIGVNDMFSKVIRLGKNETGKCRPIKVVFNEKSSVHKVLKNKYKLKNESKLIIATDQTTMQKLFYKKVEEEFKSRKQLGENNLRIKFIKNVPKIICVEPKNSLTQN